MLNTEERLLQLMEKLEANENSIEQYSKRQKDVAQTIKRLKKENAVLKDEIKMLSKIDIGEFLEQNGIPFDDVRAAVKNGVLVKPEPKIDSAENEQPTQENIENVSPVTREDLTNDNDN